MGSRYRTKKIDAGADREEERSGEMLRGDRAWCGDGGGERIRGHAYPHVG